KFQDQWIEKYFVLEKDGKHLCLLFKQSIAVMKDYNVKCHYETRHAAYTEEKAGGESSQGMNNNAAIIFSKKKKSGEVSEVATRASLVAAHEIAKHGVEGVAIDIQSQLQDCAARFIIFSLARDDSADIEHTAQFLIFVRGVTEEFEIFEELLALTSLKDRTRGRDIFEAVCDETGRNGLHWPCLVGVTTDGATCMTGAVSGLVGLMKKRGKEMGCSEIINYHCIIHQEATVLSVINLKGVM
uniref:Uncharacterized protein n=1 Tax=Latimeria chalumnae TaxID=7897 RepID=H3AFI1_LATCH